MPIDQNTMSKRCFGLLDGQSGSQACGPDPQHDDDQLCYCRLQLSHTGQAGCRLSKVAVALTFLLLFSARLSLRAAASSSPACLRFLDSLSAACVWVAPLVLAASFTAAAPLAACSHALR